MEHQSAVAVPRLLRHALRALLLLGGTVTCWLLLSSAPAQADTDAHPQAAQPIASRVVPVGPSSRATAVLERPAHAMTDTLRDAPPRVTQTLTNLTASAPAPVPTTVIDVRRVVERTLTPTTGRVADTVDRTFATVGAVVDPVVAARGVDTPSTAPVAAPDRQPATQADTGSRTVDAWSASVPAGSDAGSGAGRGAPLEATRGVPAPHEPTTPAGSWTGPSGATATLSGMLLVLFLTLRGRRRRDDADLPSDPAYPPGSSPG